MSEHPKFTECPKCRFFNPKRLTVRCQLCGVGEYFEEYVRDDQPTDDELWKIAARMSKDDD